MNDIRPFAERLPPDTIARLARAAEQRFSTAEVLRGTRRLEAIYLYGYTAEICLAAAYFRRSGFTRQQPIERDTRIVRMALARQLQTASGEAVMTNEPHPIVGWAKFLSWQRSADPELTDDERQRLREAINKSIVVYNYWRPELRYKALDIGHTDVEAVRQAVRWLMDNWEIL